MRDVYVGTENEVASVTIQKNIHVNMRYRISASQGYAGIIDGVVEVTHILTAKDITDLAGDGDVEDIISFIESYKDTALDMHTDRDEVPYEPEYSDELRRLDNTVWIVYRYPYGEGINEGLLAFPIEEFLDHTSLF